MTDDSNGSSRVEAALSPIEAALDELAERYLLERFFPDFTTPEEA